MYLKGITLRSSSYEVVLNVAIFSGEPYFSRICKAVALKLLLKNGLNSGKMWSKMSVNVVDKFINKMIVSKEGRVELEWNFKNIFVS